MEALHLIKNKMEREAQDKEINQKVDGNNKVNETEQNKSEKHNEENQKEVQRHREEVNDNNNEKTQPTIKAKPIIDENKVKREQEKQNYKVVEKIAKNEVHINFPIHNIYIIMYLIIECLSSLLYSIVNCRQKYSKKIT